MDFSSSFSKFHLSACRDFQRLINWSDCNRAGKRHIQHRRVVGRVKERRLFHTSFQVLWAAILTWRAQRNIKQGPEMLWKAASSRASLAHCLSASWYLQGSSKLRGNLLHRTCSDPTNTSLTYLEAKYQYCAAVRDSDSSTKKNPAGTESQRFLAQG